MINELLKNAWENKCKCNHKRNVHFKGLGYCYECEITLQYDFGKCEEFEGSHKEVKK